MVCIGRMQVIALDDRTLSIPPLYINYFGLDNASIPGIIAEYSNTATHVLVFQATPPPVGHKLFHAIKTAASAVPAATSVAEVVGAAGVADDLTVDNGVYELTFSRTTGLMTTIKNLKSGLSTDLAVTWGWYAHARTHVRTHRHRHRRARARMRARTPTQRPFRGTQHSRGFGMRRGPTAARPRAANKTPHRPGRAHRITAADRVRRALACGPTVSGAISALIPR
jgi:hypothetical protein